jgi:uncharacterized protein (DUF305 family)
MQQVPLSQGSVRSILVAIALFGGLNACSNSPTVSEPSSSPTATAAKTMPGMDHGKMDHGAMTHGSTTEMGHHAAMNLGAANAEYDLRFIDAMTPHHQGGVEMAQAAKQKSKRPEIQKLANNIIKAQDQEIAQMKQWRQAWYAKASKEPVAYDAKTQRSMPMSQQQRANMMMNMPLGAADAQFDLRFLNAMIPHHEGAIVMAKDALSKSKRPEIQALAKSIIASQQAEIDQMKQWRKDWYKQ